VLLWLIHTDLELADWTAARTDLSALAAEKWDGFTAYRQGIESMLPND
jgi:hypothetical protein